MGLLDTAIEGVVDAPFRLLIYGPEGIGKSTFASQAPDPFFLQTETGLNRIGPRRSPLIASFTSFQAWIEEIRAKPSRCETLVIDTVTSLEALVWAQVASERGVAHISAIRYQEGYKTSRDVFRRLLGTLDEIVASGLNVILVGHAKSEKFEEPGQLTYDRWSPQLHKDVSPIIHQWCDAVLFAGFAPISLIEEDKGFNKKRNIVGKRATPRLLHTQPHPARVAKNRYDLPDELPFSWDSFATALAESTVS